MSGPQFLSPREASQHFGLSIATVYRYLASGKLPSCQPAGRGCRVLIPRDALSRVLEPEVRPVPREARPEVTPIAPERAPATRSGPTPRWQRGGGR